ncbi:MAG: type II toxin-antitoxin system death-on-curing family toxin [Ahrensia sp.]|nr:type II toxin-antitoxin system death-on-curing family toxin [Ahrensia sp.]
MTTIYLDFETVVALHDAQIARYGGAAGVRDAGLIEAAVQRPQSGYYTDIVEEAAALWESLTMNHGFIDGNKRIGFAAAATFLRMNGIRVMAEEGEVSTFVLSQLESGTFNKNALEDWLHSHTVPVKS